MLGERELHVLGPRDAGPRARDRPGRRSTLSGEARSPTAPTRGGPDLRCLVGDPRQRPGTWVIGGPGQPPVDVLLTIAADEPASSTTAESEL